MALQIVDGPSKWDLVLALFNVHPDHREVRTFKCVSVKAGLSRTLKPIEIEVWIYSVALEDGSGQSFLIHATGRGTAQRYEIWYRTDSREGTLGEISTAGLSPKCPKCGGMVKRRDDEGTYKGGEVHECLTCKVECDWDVECHGPFQFVYGDQYGDQEGHGRSYIGISFCSPHNHD